MTDVEKPNSQKLHDLLSANARQLGSVMPNSSQAETPPLEFRVFFNPDRKAVIFEFSQPLQFIGFEPSQALEIGKKIVSIAEAAMGKKQSRGHRKSSSRSAE